MERLLQVRSVALTHPGRKRANNEDFITFFEPGDLVDLRDSGCLYIVADGVGGASMGERASRYAAERVLYEYYQHPEVEPGERLKQAIRLSCFEIYEYAERNFRRMATTLVAAVIRENQLTIANVGDSRAYLIREGKAWQKTIDHNPLGKMVQNGEMTEEQALHSKAKNRLERALGAEEDVLVDVFGPIPLQAGDRILLCSDGLARYTLVEDIAILGGQGPLDEAVERSIDYANQEGGIDNISVVLIALEPAPTTVVEGIRAARGHTPERLDWDVMDTQPEVNVKKGAAGKKKETFRSQSGLASYLRTYLPILQQNAMLLTIAAVLTCVVGVIGLYLGSEYFGSGNSPTVGLSGNGTTFRQTPLSLDTMEPADFILTQSALRTQAAIMTQSAIDQEQTLEAIQAQEATQTAASTKTTIVPNTLEASLEPTPTESTEPVGICAVRVESGDTLGKILDRFDKDYRTINNFYFYPTGCTQAEGWLECNEDERKESDDFGHIEVGWWIEIPMEEMLQGKCKNHNGLLIRMK